MMLAGFIMQTTVCPVFFNTSLLEQRLGSLELKKPNSSVAGIRLELCRGDWTRTSDPHVPNVVRYQLRYTPQF